MIERNGSKRTIAARYGLSEKDEEAAQAAREKLLQGDDASAIDPNFPILTQPSPDQLGNASLPNLRLAPVKEGEGVIVGLIDSAVQRQGTPLVSFLLPGISVAGDGTALPEDRPTHGTAMWETILRGLSTARESGSGSSVRVLPVDVYGNNPSTTTYEVAEGIVRAMEAGASIINLSLGSDGDTPYLHEIIKEGQKAGRVFVASAGNEPVKTPTYPAAYPEVIAVTAGDGRGGIASYANQGEFVDIVGPGTSMILFNGLSWRVSGTSPAAAGVAGLRSTTARSGSGTSMSRRRDRRPSRSMLRAATRSSTARLFTNSLAWPASSPIDDSDLENNGWTGSGETLTGPTLTTTVADTLLPSRDLALGRGR